MHARDWFLVFIAIFIPPLAVWLKRGFFTKDLLINFLLFLLGFFPGLIHALYVISCHPYEENEARYSHLSSSDDNYGSLAWVTLSTLSSSAEFRNKWCVALLLPFFFISFFFFYFIFSFSFFGTSMYLKWIIM